jgi:uncharacterized phage protein gp47/JayE
MFKYTSRESIINRAVNDLLAQSSISQLAPGSKARAIVEAIGNVVGDVAADISLGLLNSLLPNATGSALDAYAEMVGIQRLPEIPARVTVADQNLKYYVRTGTFGDINNGSDITIPAGTEIRLANDRGFNETIFVQRNTVVLPAASSEYYFAGDQLGMIQSRGIGPNALTRHNFTGYSDAAFQSLLVTNTKGIAGRARETDNNLRFRITQTYTGNAAANQTSIRISALMVPGVNDVRIIHNKSGMGTFDVVVYGNTPIVSPSVIQAVQNQVNKYQAVGVNGIAVAPRIVGISLTGRLKFDVKASQSDKNAAINRARDAARVYIENISPDQDFIINELAAVILSADGMIKDFGSPNKPFDSILIWRHTSDHSVRYSRDLIANYRVKIDEDLTAEPFLTNPINLTEA